MIPSDFYQRDLAQHGFSYDSAQENAVKKLDELHHQLVARSMAKPVSTWAKWNPFSASPPLNPVRGLYFWGGVGRGKTYLMDIFYDSLPFEKKLRLHFHRFMRQVHAGLKQHAGEPDPLVLVADGLAAKTVVLCFDEFFVTDITDAMILGRLMQELFQRGVSLVATSNIEPDQLYKDGLQRSRFLPAIALINQHTEVVNVDNGIDYRLRTLERLDIYHTPINDETNTSMAQAFEQLVADINEVSVLDYIEIEGRKISIKRECEDVIWFDFYALCDIPRSQNDYIEIAREYHTVLLSGVPVFDKADDLARRFINMVDEFYDRGVNLILSAEAELDGLYKDGRLAFEFQRTQSRLLEMQSKEFLAREHKA